MNTHFQALVQLLRASHIVALSHFELRLRCVASDRLRSLASELASESSPFPTVVHQDGAERPDGTAGLVDGQLFEIVVSRVTHNSRGVWQNLRDMLTWQDGTFLNRLPAEFYLVDEDHSSAEPATKPEVAAYQRIPKFLAFLQETSDARYEIADRDTFVIVTGKKISVPVLYTVDDLASMPAEPLIDHATAVVLSAPQKPEKLELLKRVVVRTLQDIGQEQRFARLLISFAHVVSAFEADRDHYMSEFSFEKLRESFERKKLDYVLKIDAAVGDLVGKVLAIPIGQAVIVSQYTQGANFANFALLAGAISFTAIGALVFYSHHSTLNELATEIAAEREATEKKHPELFERVKDVFGPVRRRAIAGRVIAWFTLVLMLLGLALSVWGFLRMPSTCAKVEQVLSIKLSVCGVDANDSSGQPQ